MSLIFVELWSERPEWRALDGDARAAFMDRVNGALSPVLDKSVALLAAADLAPHGPQGWRHLAVWRADTAASVAAFRNALQQAGWYAMFDQTDVAGMETALADILAHHVGAR